MKDENTKNIQSNSIKFEPATLEHQHTIFFWLNEPHVKEFWDNSQEHKDDIIYFMQGEPREERLSYWDGVGPLCYWVASLNDKPYAFLMTHEEGKSIDHVDVEPSDFLVPYLSKSGKTFALDFFIGDKQYLGQGLGAKTLRIFIDYFVKNVELKTDTFIISPYLNNPRAIHVYEKAGFIKRGQFAVKNGYFSNQTGIIMVKNITERDS